MTKHNNITDLGIYHMGLRAVCAVREGLSPPVMLGKIESKRRRGQQRIRWLDDITDSMDMNLNKPPGDSEG